MGREVLKERQRQVREDAILEAARELMTEQSYAEISMDDLAQRVGISKATLYQHFPSKEELAVRVVLLGMRRGEEHMNTLDPALPAMRRLEQVLRSAISRRADLRAAKLMLARTCIRQHPDYLDQHARLRARFAELIEEAKVAGDIRPELSTEVVLRVFESLVRDIDYADLLAAGNITITDMADSLVTIFFEGVGRRRVPKFLVPGS
jgi:AcrR family transcriptional regulator